MSELKKIISYKRFNPNFHHLRIALKDENLRFIFLYGGSSSAKSYSTAQAFLLECISNAYNTMVFRKVGSTISDSIYKTFQEAIKTLRLDHFFLCQENIIKCFNGSYIKFKGLDESEKIKGLESYQYVFCEEVSDFEELDFKQIRKRLRGRKGQKIISLFNPISEEHWIKKKIFDKEDLIEVSNNLYGILKDNLTNSVLPPEYSEVSKKWTNTERTVYNPRKGKYEIHKPDTVIIKSTYLNNFWVVGSPDGSYGFYDYQTIADFEKDKINDYAYYLIYALGEWGTVKTGGEFFHAFEPSIHKKKCPYLKNLPIHISIDNNVLPYISVSFWQIEMGDINKVRQIAEIAAEDPFNTVTKSSELTVEYLKKIGNKEKIILYGDASTKSSNTIDEDKLSFFDKFKEYLEKYYIVEERMPKSNPSVPMTGEFINAIYSGNIKAIDISIDECCKISINDYIRIKKDVNGGILKSRIKDKSTGQTYEQFGHFSDTKRYFISQAFKDEYIRFSMKRKRNKHNENNMKYYDHKKTDLTGSELFVYITPFNGLYPMIFAHLKNDRLYIDKASLLYETPGNEMLEHLLSVTNALISFEASDSYFQYIRELRMSIENIRAGKEYVDKEKRVEVFSDFIRNNIYFRSDYELDNDYVAFVNNMMDFDGKNNIESINCVAALSEFVRRNRKDNFNNK